MAKKDLALAWTSVAFGFGGYETASRFILGGLIERGTQVSLRPMDAHKAQDAALSSLIGEARLRDLASRVGEPSSAHARVTFHAPGWFTTPEHTEWTDFYTIARAQDPGAAVHIGFCMFETDRVDASWARSCNAMDEIWVPSEFNRETFMASGVDPAKLFVVPLGLEFDRYQPATVPPLDLPNRAGFNFLSVFEWNKRKGYDMLLRTYAETFTADDDVALHVRTYGYANAGRDLAAEEALRRYYLELCPDPARAPRLNFLVERIPERDMPALYAACDAFVLPTRGEGWGLPFMEAMAMGKPTIGTRWSAHTTFMNDDNAFLIDVEDLREILPGDAEFPHEYWGHRMAEPSREHLKQVMRWVVEHPEQARARGVQARHDVTTQWIPRRAADRVAERLIARAPVAASVLWSAPLMDPSGYADEARNFVLGLDRIGVEVRTNPITWSPRTAELDSRDASVLTRLGANTLDGEYVHIEHIFPAAFKRDASAIATVGRTMYETDRIPPDWVAPCNQMDEIWVPSQFNVETFAASGVDRGKLHVLPAGFDADRFRRPATPLHISGRRGFNFLSIFDWSLRKGWDVLLRAYVEEFGVDEDVSLTIKTYSSMGLSDAQLGERVRAFVCETLGRDTREIPKIILKGGVISEADLVRLYRAADAYVMPTRGEGWGRPFMEAMASGLPTIGTNWSANTSFMHADNAYLLDYDLVDVSPAALQEVPIMRGHRWAEPRVAHLRELMREVFTDRESACARGAVARAQVLQQFDRPAVAAIVAEHLERVLGRALESRVEPFADIRPLHLDGRRKVAFLHTPVWTSSSWREVVSTYATAFTPDEDVTLVMWLDPSQGVPPDAAGHQLLQVLTECGLDPERIPDLLLVPDALDQSGIAQLYAAVDWVVPHGDPKQLAYARRSGTGVLESLEPVAWRHTFTSFLQSPQATRS